MKYHSTLCIISGVLGTAMLGPGCADETADDGRAGPDAGHETPGREAPDSGPAPDSGEGPGDSTLLLPELTPGAQGPSCPDSKDGSVGTHIVVSVSWPGSLAIAAGEGKVHLWTKADLTHQRGVVVGTARPCGTVIPALTKTSVVGGGQIQAEIPVTAWDAPSMPVFELRGRTSGFEIGDAVSLEPVASLVGLSLREDPAAQSWPAQASEISAVDHDGDGRPGVKAVPRIDPPFAAPPVDFAGVLDPGGARADEIDLAMRAVVALSGTRDSCTTAKGAAQVSHMDSHVVGCHVRGGGVCTRAQSNFIGASQPVFQVESATFETAQLPAGATCADVRAALPIP
jgi:hypothetical protein